MFSDIKEKIDDRDDTREKIIVESRKVLRESKKIIYAIHRGNLEETKERLDKIKKDIEEIKNLSDKNEPIFDAALQEYVEAAAYFYYVKENRLIGYKELDVDVENYLLGICDLTGELERRAVHSVVNDDSEEVKKVWEFVQAIYKEFLEFDFRNGHLRKKSDSIKWNLKKIEEIMYDLKLKK